MTARDLPELIAQWRERISADRHDTYHDALRDAYEVCADELEAALAGAGAVAWINPQVLNAITRHGFLDKVNHRVRLRSSPKASENSIPLFTHPAPVAVGVDEAMVERGVAAAAGVSDARLARHKVVRAIITAALEAKPHA